MSGTEDSVARFSGLADRYAKYRPSYPAPALDHILQRCELARGSLLIDVGCGTGIASRLFAERGLTVLGIEPNDEMRARAQATAVPPGVTPPRYCDGTAQATGVPSGAAAVVLAAQAFHWFEPESALREFHRILEPRGWVVLMWNERDESDPGTAAYGAVVSAGRDAAAHEHQRKSAGAVLLGHRLFVDAERVVFRNTQETDEEGLVGRALSVSYAPRALTDVERFSAELRDVFARYERNGTMVLHYETAVYSAQKPPQSR